jgi:hypothetical protein
MILRLLNLAPKSVRHRLLRQCFRADERDLEGLRVSVAATPEEHEQAARLLQQMYERRGIATPSPSGLRVLAPHLLPSTAVFIARDTTRPGSPMIGTLSLVADSPLGLPMDRIYKAELDALRAAGRRIAEVGALCLLPSYRRTGIMYLLARIMHDHALAERRDDLVIAVHPAAADYYAANMLFEAIGPVRSYPGLTRLAPALAMRLDLRTHLERCCARFGQRSYDHTSPLWMFFGRDNPQIASLDRSELAQRRHLEARRRVAAHLVMLCPDALTGLSEAAAIHLADAVPALAPVLLPGRELLGPVPVPRRRSHSQPTRLS